MIEKTNRTSIVDDFLVKEEFVALRNIMTRHDFPWCYNPTVVRTPKPLLLNPGYFIHMIYDNGMLCSSFYNPLGYLLSQLDIMILTRIRANLNPRLPEPYIFDFHIDAEDMGKDISAKWTTSIFYINTNNGYTELETGEKIESIANRLVSFPLSTRHRIVTQTDEQARMLINFGYLKKPK